MSDFVTPNGEEKLSNFYQVRVSDTIHEAFVSAPREKRYLINEQVRRLLENQLLPKTVRLHP